MSKYKPELVLSQKLNTDGLASYTINDIERLLASLPVTKYKYGGEVIETQKEFEQAKFDHQRELSLAHQIASAKREELGLTAEADRKAYAMNQDNVVQAEINLIEKKAEYELAKLKFGYADDLFVSVRKVATIVEKQLDAQKEAEKYGHFNGGMIQ